MDIVEDFPATMEGGIGFECNDIVGNGEQLPITPDLFSWITSGQLTIRRGEASPYNLAEYAKFYDYGGNEIVEYVPTKIGLYHSFNGPFVQCFDSAGNRVPGVVDWQVTGYNNGITSNMDVA
jgi:hypothetical protein